MRHSGFVRVDFMNRIVNLFRRLFSKSRLIYRMGADLYHRVLYIYAFFICFRRGIPYIKPQGPSGEYKSQFGQDRALELLGLLVPEGGVFVEVGSNHPIKNSNSYYLESKCGYSGISVDPIDYGEFFRLHRPKTQFINVAIDSSKSSVILNLVEKNDGWEDQVSSLHDEVIAHGRGFQVQQVDVPAVTLASVCKNLSQIDLLLLDVEGHEVDVLKSLDWDRVYPEVVLTENTGEFYPRRRLEKFMLSKGYRLVARIGSSEDIYQFRPSILR